MMDDDRRSRLFRLKLKLFGQFHVDARRIEQLKQLQLIFQIGTSRIAKAEPRSLVALAEKLVQILRIVSGDTQLFADSFVPQLRQCLRAFHAQPVKEKILGIVVALEKLLGIFAGAPAHGDQMKSDSIHAARINRSEIIGETQTLSGRLPRESETRPLRFGI